MGWFGDILKSVVGSIPVVGGVAKGIISVGETLLSHKQPVGGTARGKVNVFPVAPSSSTSGILSASPVMPGGGIATPMGVAPQPAGNPPSHYGSSRRSGKRKKRKATSRTRSRSARKKGRGGVTYHGKHYSARQAKFFVPRGRR